MIGRVVGVAAMVLLLAAGVAGLLPARGNPARTVVIAMVNIAFSPTTVAVDPGQTVTLIVFNNDTATHTFDLDAFNVHLGTVASPMAPGTNRSATFTAGGDATFWFHCSIPGHAALQGDGTYTGMAGRIVVGRGTPPRDLTLVYVIAGVAAAAGAGIAAFLWIRRRKSP